MSPKGRKRNIDITTHLHYSESAVSRETISYIPFAEPADVPRRAEHAPVLLDPWNAKHPLDADSPYLLGSTDRIQEKLDKSMVDAMDWWVESPDLAAVLSDIMSDSLWDAQMMRIHRNAVRQPVKRFDFIDDDMTDPFEDDEPLIDPLWELDQSDPLVAKVMDGRASASEIVAFRKCYPQVGSTELAKESHPLDFHAARDLKADIEDAIDVHNGLRIYAEPRYKLKTFDGKHLIMTAVRKQVIAAIPNGNEQLMIIQRESFIIRGDEEARGDDVYLPRLMKNPERRHELWEKAEGYLAYIDDTKTTRYVDLYPQIAWLQPLTTSAYIRESKPWPVMK